MSIRYSVSVTWWGLLDSTGKMQNFQNIFGGRPGNSFSTGEASKKPIEDNMKIQRGELTNTTL